MLFKGRGAISGTGASSQTLEGRGPILKAGRIFELNRQGFIFQRKLRQLEEPTKGHRDIAPQPSSESIFDVLCANNPQLLSREMWPSFRTSNFPPHLFCTKKLQAFRLPHQTLSGEI